MKCLNNITQKEIKFICPPPPVALNLGPAGIFYYISVPRHFDCNHHEDKCGIFHMYQVNAQKVLGLRTQSDFAD